MTDASEGAPSTPWVPAGILGDFQWTGGHFAGGWQNFFEQRGVAIQSTPPTDPNQPWVPPELLSSMAFAGRHFTGGWQRYLENRGIQVRG